MFKDMQRTTSSSRLLTVVGISVVACQVANANLIQDSGFELGPVFGPWIQGGNTVSDTINPPNMHTALPHSGNYQAWMGAPSMTSYIAQNVPTIAGHSYLIDFWLANGVAGPASYDISWGGVSYLSASGNLSDFGYKEFSFIANAVGSTTTLKLEFFNMMDWFQVDDVSVTPFPAVVPDQGPGLVLAGAALIGLFAWSRSVRSCAA